MKSEKSSKKSRGVSILFILQGIMTLIYINFIMPNVPILNSNYGLVVFDIVFIGIVMKALLDLKKINHFYKEEAEQNLINSNIENMEELINIINNQKTNHHMHLQTISTLLYLNNNEEMANYIKDITNDYTQEAVLKDVGHNVITGIVNAKKVIARENRVRFYIRGKIEDSNFDINPSELATVLSNVLNNAIEACKYYGENSWTNIIINDDKENLYFKVINRGHVNEDILENIFEMGATTKQSIGKGYGLFIVKQIIDKYNGEISIKNNDNNTVDLNITIPRRMDGTCKDLLDACVNN